MSSEQDISEEYFILKAREIGFQDPDRLPPLATWLSTLADTLRFATERRGVNDPEVVELANRLRLNVLRYCRQEIDESNSAPANLGSVREGLEGIAGVEYLISDGNRPILVRSGFVPREDGDHPFMSLESYLGRSEILSSRITYKIEFSDTDLTVSKKIGKEVVTTHFENLPMPAEIA